MREGLDEYRSEYIYIDFFWKITILSWGYWEIRTFEVSNTIVDQVNHTVYAWWFMRPEHVGYHNVALFGILTTFDISIASVPFYSSAWPTSLKCLNDNGTLCKIYPNPTGYLYDDSQYYYYMLQIDFYNYACNIQSGEIINKNWSSNHNIELNCFANND